MEVILDTNFIISCVLKRIDFIEQLENLGFKVLVPREVMKEMKDLKKNENVSHEERNAIDVAFEMIEHRKVKKVRVGERNTDAGLIKKGRAGAYIATLDRGIKREIPNKIVIFDSKNRVGVE